jgi:signal transduction histidine kinase
MSHLLWSLGYQTRWRIFARVLPVLIFAVLFIGAFSWMVFSRQVTGTVGGVQQDEMAALLDNLSHRAALEGLSLEQPTSRSLDDCPVTGENGASWSLFDSGLVAGVALAPGEDGRQDPAFILADDLAADANRTRMAAWLERQRHTLEPGFRPGSWTSVRDPEGPILIESPRDKAVYLFPPVILQEGATDRSVAVLPVLVRGGPHASSHHGPKIYFLKLQTLIEEFHLSGWWCILDAEGRVLAVAEGGPPVGAILGGDTASADERVFGDVTRAELSRGLASADGGSITLVGDRLQPWVVTSGAARYTPFSVVVAREATGFRMVTLRYLSFVLAVILLALVIAVMGITRAVDSVSRSLDRLAVSQDQAQRQALQKEESLRDTLDDMRLLDKAKDDFLVLISHEVRTPLTAIMGGVDYLKSSLTKVSDAERETLERLNVIEIAEIIESSGERLTGFMNDAIQMASIQSTDRQLNLRPHCPWRMIEIGLCGIREKAREKDISVENLISEDADWMVLADQNVLKVAFEKVLDNALSHNFEGGRIVIREADGVPGSPGDPRLPGPESFNRLKAQMPPGSWSRKDITWRLIEIFNTGEAIPEDRQWALFRKFELVGRIEHHHKGSGLSLPIANAAVENHGGRIFMHSEPGAGNSFFLLLPTVSRAAASQHASRDDQVEGFGGRAGHEDMGQMTDAAALEVELGDPGPGVPCGPDESGGGVHRAGGSHDQQEVALGRGQR